MHVEVDFMDRRDTHPSHMHIYTHTHVELLKRLAVCVCGDWKGKSGVHESGC